MAAPPTIWSPYNHENGETATWENMYQGYFCNLSGYSDYLMKVHEVTISRNTYVAIKLLIDKCNALQTQLDALGNGLTWQTICEAWAANDFEGAAFTIAFIDRMRQLIWDKPFYAAWASKPEQQEF